jgi:hypothetical protein
VHPCARCCNLPCPRTRRALLRNPGCLRGAGERSARREPTLKKMVGYSGFEKPASAAWSIVQAPGNRLRRTQRQRLMLSPVRAPILLTRARARAIRANDRAILNRLQQFGYVSRRINPPQRPRRSDARGRQVPAGAILFENSQTQGILQKPRKIDHMKAKSNM